VQTEACKPAVVLGLSLAAVPNADTAESCPGNAHAHCLWLRWFGNFLVCSCRSLRSQEVSYERQEGDGLKRDMIR